MLKSESITTIAPALVKAQVDIKGALKDANNPHFNRRYADLGSVMEACKSALNRQDIAVVQATEPIDGSLVRVSTYLIHKSGEYLGCELTLRSMKDDPQSIGSAITYARRYTLSSIAGVCPEDDDGHAASHQQAQPPSHPAPPAATKRVVKPGTLPEETSPLAPVAASLAADKARKEAAMALLVANLGPEMAKATLEQIKLQNVTNATRLKALEDAAALYKDKAP